MNTHPTTADRRRVVRCAELRAAADRLDDIDAVHCDPGATWLALRLRDYADLLEVTVLPSRRGRPPGSRRAPGSGEFGPYFDASSVELTWR